MDANGPNNAGSNSPKNFGDVDPATSQNMQNTAPSPLISGPGRATVSLNAPRRSSRVRQHSPPANSTPVRDHIDDALERNLQAGPPPVTYPADPIPNIVQEEILTTGSQNQPPNVLLDDKPKTPPTTDNDAIEGQRQQSPKLILLAEPPPSAAAAQTANHGEGAQKKQFSVHFLLDEPDNFQEMDSKHVQNSSTPLSLSLLESPTAATDSKDCKSPPKLAPLSVSFSDSRNLESLLAHEPPLSPVGSELRSHRLTEGPLAVGDCQDDDSESMRERPPKLSQMPGPERKASKFETFPDKLVPTFLVSPSVGADIFWENESEIEDGEWNLPERYDIYKQRGISSNMSVARKSNWFYDLPMTLVPKNERMSERIRRVMAEKYRRKRVRLTRQGIRPTVAMSLRYSKYIED
eukprot:GEMP01028397.1.p1 GENE.GEMP01028397.1~~GEMP01028397.1.p1  ORF type:complete len:407 (+),score=53.07 GEMP01028397.1:244-1464(+)